MPRPKKTGRRITIRLSEQAWKNLEGKGNIAKLINKAVEKMNEQETPTASTAHDINHLNINQKGGVIQTYLNKRQERIDLRKERIVERYLTEQAIQKAKAEGELERAKIKEEFANRERFQKRYIRDGKPTVDWGDSEGVDGFQLGDQ